MEKVNDIVDNLTDDIKELITSVIERNSERRLKSDFDDIIVGLYEELESELHSTNQCLEEYNEENLTASRIEMEGYKRGILCVVELFKEADKWNELVNLPERE